MGRSKDFPVIFYDLLIKYKSKSIADKEYKECLIMANEQGLSKEARLDDIDTTIVPKSSVKEEALTMPPPEKKKRVSGAFSHSEKVKVYSSCSKSDERRF